MKSTSSGRGDNYLLTLVVGALGVVYGDIGTSPLYALRECFMGKDRLPVSEPNVFGVISLILWSLTLIVAIKYLTFVMQANNKGEGGILSLLSLAFPDGQHRKKHLGRAAMIGMGVFGAALLYGDGMITPAISVLSAVEGLNIATTRLEHYVLPITIVILIALFTIQRSGTGMMGKIFGPIMAVWFVVLAVLGVSNILVAPEILSAFNPLHAARFLISNGWVAFVVLGSVFLCVTGGEALYADMGHFGRRPIQLAWFSMVMPALMLNYLGQGALLLHTPTAAENPFYLMAPRWSLYPLVVLATLATVIASQALISGAFSLTMQAIQMGYIPRLEIDHTSSHERGQVYMPRINWLLMFACIGLVLGFRTSSNLAGAYGIAVTLTMVITTLLFYYAARRIWGWSAWKAGALCGLFLIIEVTFAAANFLKVLHGGWFPLLVGLILFTLMATWKTGRRLLGERLRAASLPFSLFLEDVLANPPVRVSGTAIFLAGNSEGTPLALLHNLKHNKVLHQRVVILTVCTADVPHVDPTRRSRVEQLAEGFYRVTGTYGFMEDPSVPEILEHCKTQGLICEPEKSTFFLSRESIIPTSKKGMWIWREKLFAVIARNAQPATAFFRLPANRVVELGMQVEI